MDEDRKRWDERYAARREGPVTSPEAPEALALLDDAMLAQIPTTGFAVDIACGVGAQSLWLAQRGMHVLAIDVSPIAIDLTRAAADEHDLAGQIEVRVVDLDAGLPEDAAGAALVICQRFRSPELYPAIVGVLGQGGTAIVTVLSEVGLDGTPGAFHAPGGELVDAFTSDKVDVLASSEQAGVASIVVRRR